jgi:hypothetical protein
MLAVLVLLRVGSVLPRRRRTWASMVTAVACLCMVVMSSKPALADSSAAASDNGDFLADFYVGVKAGPMPVHFDAERVERQLHADGYDSVYGSGSPDAVGGALYVGYQLAPFADVEFGYSYRAPKSATLTGIVPADTSIPTLLRDTARALNGYGNTYSLSFRSPIEVAPRFTIEPRFGAFLWETSVTTEFDGDSAHDTRSGGGITAGAGIAYRLWRGLKIGVGVDYFRGTQENIATLYGGSLEWRFGSP